MYAGPQVNHEEYLLGRKSDKNVEILKEDDKPVNILLMSLFDYTYRIVVMC